ncbi:MAG: Maf family nucleotide pyrophosphatase [Proteobacteria bacterium]|jgi:septum formation protein|nr:Maf family nucleotide pyrophosphatase [Pseudomonadota bacterium]
MREDFDIYLASASPRRRELLAQINVRFQLLEVEVSEQPQLNEPARVYVQRLALAKARAGLMHLPAADKSLVLGADTAVVVDDAILGKPEDEVQAKAMLRQLSGRSHQVMSAVAVMCVERKAVKLNVSTVTMRELDEPEIEAYWNSGECRDKAGAYAIQGRAAIFVSALQGSYSGVMGLPLYETALILKEFGINPLK